MSRTETAIAVVSSEMARPYAYGSADCFFLGLALVDALLGTKHVKNYSGAYKTLMGAQRALRKRGHTTLVTFFEQAIELEPIAAGIARVGDLAICELDGAEHVAVFTGNGFLAKTERGPMPFGFGAVKQAFRV